LQDELSTAQHACKLSLIACELQAMFGFGCESGLGHRSGFLRAALRTVEVELFAAMLAKLKAGKVV
jgi:hypothetical protein